MEGAAAPLKRDPLEVVVHDTWVSCPDVLFRLGEDRPVVLWRLTGFAGRHMAPAKIPGRAVSMHESIACTKESGADTRGAPILIQPIKA